MPAKPSGRWTRSSYDTQLYVRDSVINYVDAQTGPIAPAIEGRLVFVLDGNLPLITVDM